MSGERTESAEEADARFVVEHELGISLTFVDTGKVANKVDYLTGGTPVRRYAVEVTSVVDEEIRKAADSWRKYPFDGASHHLNCCWQVSGTGERVVVRALPRVEPHLVVLAEHGWEFDARRLHELMTAPPRWSAR